MGGFWGVYACRWSSVGAARRAVTEYGARCGIFGDDLCDIELAVGEALTNAAEHGLGHSGFFEVGCRLETGDEFVVEVRDSGPAPAYRTPRERAPSDRGFGIQLMYSLMDRVTIHDNGTRLRLRKRVRRVAAVGDSWGGRLESNQQPEA